MALIILVWRKGVFLARLCRFGSRSAKPLVLGSSRVSSFAAPRPKLSSAHAMARGKLLILITLGNSLKYQWFKTFLTIKRH